MSSSTPPGWPRSGCGRTSGLPERVPSRWQTRSAWTPWCPPSAGRRVAITLDNRAEVDGELHVGLQLVRLGERAHSVFVGPFPKGRSTRSVVVPFCRGGCRLDAINFGGPATSRIGLNGVIRVTGISVDGQRLEGGIEGAGWAVYPEASDADMVRSVRSEGRVISVDVGSGESDRCRPAGRRGARRRPAGGPRSGCSGRSAEGLLRRDQRHGVRDAGGARGAERAVPGSERVHDRLQHADHRPRRLQAEGAGVRAGPDRHP